MSPEGQKIPFLPLNLPSSPFSHPSPVCQLTSLFTLAKWRKRGENQAEHQLQLICLLQVVLTIILDGILYPTQTLGGWGESCVSWVLFYFPTSLGVTLWDGRILNYSKV